MRAGTRTLVWLGTASLVILLARAIAYSLAPGPTATLLQQRAGGPALPTLVLVSLVLGVSIAAAICWLVSVGVRERALLERRVLAQPASRLRTGRTLASALALAIATSLVGGLLEAYIHWRAGLGWHGLHCLFGPVHRELIPIDTALSLVAAAVVAGTDHVVAWMRRTIALLGAVVPRVTVSAVPNPLVAVHVPTPTLCLAAGGPRAPPIVS